MKLKEIQRTASVAWSPIQSCPAIATGTMAGALDESFSNTTELEIFKLDWAQKGSEAELKASGVVTSNARFNRLAWTSPTGEFNMGLIAGGMENGELDFWNPEKILAGASVEDCLFSRQKIHNGAIRGLDFNPFQPNLLATGAVNGEVYLWNLGDLTKPYTPGPKSSKLEDVTCLKWNQKVQHIMATSSTSGYTVVWDLKNRREVMSLGYLPSNSNGFGMAGARGVTALAWNPESATQLVTASEDDNNPVIMLWDLRNANAPEKVFTGHTKGVLSLSWCRQDSDLLLSCGKDNRTICWNPRSGDIVGEFPASRNWSFDVQFSPRNPNLLSTSSFDNQVSIYSLLASDSGATTETVVDDDPFSQAIAPQTKPFALKNPPKWFRRPVGASFGFGGQLVSFHDHSSGEKKVSISSVQLEPEMIQRADELSNAIESSTIAEYCEKKSSQSQKESDKLSWDLMRLLLDKDCRKQLNQILEVETTVSEDAVSKVIESLGLPPKTPPTSDKATPEEVAPSESEEKKEEEVPQDEVSSLFQGGEDSKKEEDFFSNSQLHSTTEAVSDPSSQQPKIEPFAIDASSTSLEGLLSQMVVLGDFKGAAELSLKASRFDDALLFAMCGSKDLMDSIRQKVFKLRRDQFSYLRLLESVMQGDFMGVVLSADLSEWKQIVSMISTYAQGHELQQLYSALGSRLAQSEDLEQRQNALLCFLLASSLEHAVALWVSEYYGSESVKDVRSHPQLLDDNMVLQDLVEKITIFSKVITSEETVTDNQSETAKLNLLYTVYYEYAVLMASQGRLDIAASYLQMIPQDHTRPSASCRDDFAAFRYQLSYAGVDVGALDIAYPYDFNEIGGSTQQYETATTNNYTAPAQQTSYPAATRDYNYGGYGTQQSYPSQPPTQNQAQAQVPGQQSSQPLYSGYQQPQYGMPVPQPTPNPNPVPATPFEQTSLYNQYPNYPPGNNMSSYPPAAQQDAGPPPSAQKGGPAWNDPPAEVFSVPPRSASKAKSSGTPAITSPFGATGPAPPSSQGYSYGAPPASLPPPPQGGRAPAPFYSRKDPPSQPPRAAAPNQGAQPPSPHQGFQNQMPPQQQQQPGYQNPPPPQGQPPAFTPAPAQSAPPQRPLYQTSNPAPPSHSPQGNSQGGPPSAIPAGISGPGTPRPNYGNARPEQPKPSQPATPPKPQPVAIDRSKMPPKYKQLVDLLTRPVNSLKSGGVPPPQQRMLADVDRRMTQLLDTMNQDQLHPNLVEPLTQFGKALEAKDFNAALGIQTAMVSQQVNQVGPWVAGLKHLVSLLRSQSAAH